MVYFDVDKKLEVKSKWKGGRPRASVRMLCEAIAAMETELRALPHV
jgi:hypothetical protein